MFSSVWSFQFLIRWRSCRGIQRSTAHTSTPKDHFDPSSKDYMINFMVDDLDAMIARCREHGVKPAKIFPDEFNGSFAHIIDPEGRKIELWQPSAPG